MGLIFKAALGAIIVILIAILSKTRNYYIAGLIPLFPTFALIAHYIVVTERDIAALKTTIIFGIWAMLPYFIYLVALYFLIDYLRLVYAFTGAVICWILCAWILLQCWIHYHR